MIEISFSRSYNLFVQSVELTLYNIFVFIYAHPMEGYMDLKFKNKNCIFDCELRNSNFAIKKL